MNRTSSSLAALAVLLAFSAIAGCSSGAGFGSPPPYPPAPQAGSTVQPGSSGQNGNEGPDSSPTPETPLSVDSATARFAYDASAADPVKASRLVEVTFALASTLASPMPVPNVAIAADKAPAVNIPLTLTAAPGQDTVETMVAVASPKDDTDTKSLELTFGDGKKLVLAGDTIDYPDHDDPAMTPLDDKVKAGGVSLDDVAITPLLSPIGGLHFDLTFSITNASKKDANIAAFTVIPPKEPPAKQGDQPQAYPVRFVIPIDVTARSSMDPMSVVIPYYGKAKTLPSGTYDLVATDKSGNSIAQNSGPLL
jgi:hypothetical protein